MPRHLILALCAGLLFALQFIVETARATDPFDMVTFLTDLFETGLLVGAIVLTTFVSTEARTLRAERRGLIGDLADARRDGERWREAASVHVTGLSRAIAAQFRTWGLTETEADVAGLMLKGLSHKEIANLRGGSEATVRQHATSVYRKSHLSGRTQLTAFFLEDMLNPHDRTGALTVLEGGAGR